MGLRGELLHRLLALGSSHGAVEHNVVQALVAHHIVDVDGGVEGARAVRIVEHDLGDGRHLPDGRQLNVHGGVGNGGALPGLDILVHRAGIALVRIAVEVHASSLALRITEEAVEGGSAVRKAAAASNEGRGAQHCAVGAGFRIDCCDGDVPRISELPRGPVSVAARDREAGVQVVLGGVGHSHATALGIGRHGDRLGC